MIIQIIFIFKKKKNSHDIEQPLECNVSNQPTKTWISSKSINQLEMSPNFLLFFFLPFNKKRIGVTSRSHLGVIMFSSESNVFTDKTRILWIGQETINQQTCTIYYIKNYNSRIWKENIQNKCLLVHFDSIIYHNGTWGSYKFEKSSMVYFIVNLWQFSL